MGIDKCLERTRFHLENNQKLDQNARAGLEEAATHLQIALELPGWVEWMESAVSAAYETLATDIPAEISMSWSDSPGGRPDLIGADCLKTLRSLNKPGVTDEDLDEAGDHNRSLKIAAAITEDEEDKSLSQDMKSPKKQKQSRGPEYEVTGILQSAAHAPTSINKGVISRRKDKERRRNGKTAGRRCSECLAGSQHDSERTGDLCHLRYKPRLARRNSISSSRRCYQRQATNLCVFGDIYELGHLTEALDLLDIKSSVCMSVLFDSDG